MITSVRMVNFKNFADETLKVGPFTVIVGANASGKSNIRDAFRFLHGIGRGYTLAEILGGKYGAGGQMEWAGIRGAPNQIGRLDPEFSIPHSTFSIDVQVEQDGREELFYSISVWFDAFGPSGFTVSKEKLSTESGPVYTIDHTGSEYADSLMWVQPGKENGMPISLSRLQPALSQLFLHYDAIYEEYLSDPGFLPVCQKMRFMELSPERMREPSFPGVIILGDNGANLPSVLEAICGDAERKMTLMSWVQELTPMDVKDFDFPRDPSGRVHLQIVERNGRKVSAYSASDGTLRFLGILAALLNANEGGLYFFEEIDNGIHPNRLWLLLDFIERQTAKGGVQVITTTHSPALLSWIRDETFENTSVVYRYEHWADSVIRPIAGLYNLRELRKSQGLGRLFTGGWLETAMACSEGNPDLAPLDDDDEDDWEQGTLE